MFRISLLPIIILIAGLTVSCKKGALVPGETNGSLRVELLQLPGTPDIDVYFDGVWVDSLLPGQIIGKTPLILLPAGKEGILSFKKKGTDVLLLDTAILVPTEATFGFRIACSEDLGMNEFMSGVAVNADSCRLRFVNTLHPLLQPDGVDVDAYIYKLNQSTNGYELITILHPYLKKKMYPAVMMFAAREPDGSPCYYYARYKNVATGGFLIDGVWNEYSSVYIEPGRDIISISSQLDFGDGVFYFINDAIFL